MKLCSILPLLLVALAPAAFAADAPKPTVATNAVVHLTITGMHCDGCAKGIRSELLRLKGVGFAEVRLKSTDATVALDTNLCTTAQLTKAVEEAGYQAAVKK